MTRLAQEQHSTLVTWRVVVSRRARGDAVCSLYAQNERHLAEARSAYERAPTNAESIVWLGRRLAYLGRIREAINVYSQGIALHPDNPWLYRHRGHRYLTVRDLRRSVADFERATQLVEGQPDQIEPDGQPNASNTPIGTLHSNIAYHLGLAYYLQGDFARAVPVYRRELADARNDDRLVSTAHWLYMSLRRLLRPGTRTELATRYEVLQVCCALLDSAPYDRLQRSEFRLPVKRPHPIQEHQRRRTTDRHRDAEYVRQCAGDECADHLRESHHDQTVRSHHAAA